MKAIIEKYLTILLSLISLLRFFSNDLNLLTF